MKKGVFILLTVLSTAVSGLPFPHVFTENLGQWSDEVLYRAETDEGPVWFTANGFYVRGVFTRIRAVPDGTAVSAVGALPHLTHFLKGNEPSQWTTGARSFSSVVYTCDAPEGFLVFTIESGSLQCRQLTAPVVDTPRTSACRVGLVEAAQVSLIFSTYLGGSGDDRTYSTAVDSQGGVYVTGRTGSTDFPTQNPYQDEFQGGDWDCFVAKFSPDGSQLEYATYIGGSQNENGYGIKVDSLGFAYITGPTASQNFPLVNPIQPALAGASDAFVLKLSPQGDELVFSTFLGGSGSETGRDIATDGSGRALVTGFTSSPDFPLNNPFQDQIAGGSGDAFCVMLNSQGNGLVYGSYLGGSGDEFGEGVYADHAGNGYFCGQTGSPDFPLLVPFQAAYGGGSTDGYLARLTPAGQVVYCTYLGGSGTDLASNVFVDAADCPYLTGETGSPDFPVLNPIQGSLPGASAIFITKFEADGENLAYGTYLGGSGMDQGRDIAVSPSGSAFVTGYTSSLDFPVENAFQGFHAGGGNDAVAVKLSPDGGQLEYSTYLGGSGNDSSRGIALFNDGSACITGGVFSTDFPTYNPFQGSFGGGPTDCFIARLSPYGTGIGDEPPGGGQGLSLYYVNPFQGSLQITVAVGTPGLLEVAVMDMAGRVTKVLCAGTQAEEGLHHFIWNPGDAPAGIYLIRATRGSSVMTGKVLLL